MTKFAGVVFACACACAGRGGEPPIALAPDAAASPGANATAPSPDANALPASNATPVDAPAIQASRERWGPCLVAPGPRCPSGRQTWLHSRQLAPADVARLAAWGPDDGLIAVRAQEQQLALVAGCRVPGTYVELRRGVAISEPSSLSRQRDATSAHAEPTAADLESAKQSFLAGQQAYDEGRYDAAFRHFIAAYANAPDKHALLVNAGRAAVAGIQTGTLRHGPEVVEMRARLASFVASDTGEETTRRDAWELLQLLDNVVSRQHSQYPASAPPQQLAVAWDGALSLARGLQLPLRGAGAGCAEATHVVVALTRWFEGSERAGVKGVLVPLDGSSAAFAAGGSDAFAGCFAGVLFERCQLPPPEAAATPAASP